jgi:hypothetical protein
VLTRASAVDAATRAAIRHGLENACGGRLPGGWMLRSTAPSGAQAMAAPSRRSSTLPTPRGGTAAANRANTSDPIHGSSTPAATAQPACQGPDRSPATSPTATIAARC